MSRVAKGHVRRGAKQHQELPRTSLVKQRNQANAFDPSTTIIMSAPIQFQPSIPHPRPPITKEVRIQKLKDLLKKEKEEEKNPPKFHFLQSQVINIEKLITMYENDEILLGQEVWLINGRVVKEEDKDQEGEGPRWHEVSFINLGY